MIAIILPTRGMVFTEVENAIEDARRFNNIIVYRSWNLPIPDAQNYLTEQALKDREVTDLWFIEEDTIPPDGALEKLKDANADIACIDYSVNQYGCVARDKKTNEILWCGFGCTLVKREVFEKLEKPWFRTDKTLRLNDWQWIDNSAKYGGQDIWFGCKAREAGFKIQQVEGECKHLSLVALGQKGYNDGCHLIVIKPKIQKRQYIEKGV